MFVVVAYDVDSKRTEKLRKVLARFLEHEQNSVFMGTIGEPGLREMRKNLADVSKPGDKLLLLMASNKHNIVLERLEKSTGNGILETKEKNTHLKGSTIL